MASASQKRLGSPNGADFKKVRDGDATAQSCSSSVALATDVESTAMVASVSVDVPVEEVAILTIDVSGPSSCDANVPLEVVSTSPEAPAKAGKSRGKTRVSKPSSPYLTTVASLEGSQIESQDSDDDDRLIIDVVGVHSDSSADDVEPDDDAEVLEIGIVAPRQQDEKWVTKTTKKVSATVAKVPKSGGKPLDCSQRTVYMTGRGGYKLARDAAFKKATAFKAEIAALVGATESLTICGDSIRVVCQTAEQAAKLLKTEMILDKEIVVTIPRSHARKLEAVKPAAPKWNKGVIKRVPLFLSDAEIKGALDAVWVHRIESVKEGEKTPTRAVIIAFETELPSTVGIGLMEFKVCTYVPKPLRCAKCQRFGHKAVHCKSDGEICVKCGGNHAYSQCANTLKKCVNCGQEHSSAYKGCTKYRTVNKTLILAANTHVDYRTAAKTIAMKERFSYSAVVSKEKSPMPSQVSVAAEVQKPVTAVDDAVEAAPVMATFVKPMKTNRGARRRKARKTADLHTQAVSQSPACPSKLTSGAIRPEPTEKKDEQTQTSTELPTVEELLKRLVLGMLWLTENMSVSNRSDVFATQHAQMIRLLHTVAEPSGLFTHCTNRQRRNSLPERSCSSVTAMSQSAATSDSI